MLSRRRLPVFFALGALGLSLALAGAGARAKARSLPPSLAVVGANTYAEWDQWTGPTANLSSFTDTILADRQVGITSVRIPLYWGDVDPNGTGNYDFSGYLRAAQILAQYNMSPVFDLITTNDAYPNTEWGASKGGFPVTPSDVTAFSNFATAAANALSPVFPNGTVVFEVGNEPNQLSNDLSKADAYASLFTSVRAAVPAGVALAGPAVSTFQDGSVSTVDALAYAQEAIQAGMKPDILSVHLYNGTANPSPLVLKLDAFKEQLPNTPLYVTECGYPTGPSGDSNSITEDQQAQYLLYEIESFVSHGAAKVFIYDDRDTEGWCTGTDNSACVDPGATSSPEQGYYGIMNHSRTLKPSGLAIQNYLTNTAGVSGLSINPGTVVGGGTVTATVTLYGFAPPKGTPVTLSSNSSLATVPATVTIPAGHNAATFPVMLQSSASTVTATVTATLGSVSKSTLVTTKAASLSAVSLGSSTIFGGNPLTGTVTLTGPAPAGGWKVALWSTNSAAKVPTSVIVPAGSSSATFSVTSTGVTNAANGSIFAGLNSVAESAPLTIDPPFLNELWISSPTIVGGGSTAVTGAVTFSGNAPPSGETVKLTSSNPNTLAVPATVDVPAGSASATFAVGSAGVTTAQQVTVTATCGSYTQSVVVTVNP